MPGFNRTPFDDFMDRHVEVTNGKTFYARLAGGTYQNPDGSSRQAVIAQLKPCEELQLVPEPENDIDPNAIRVMAPSGQQIGYLESRLAGETVRRTQKGISTRAFVSNVTGGRTGQSLGCTIGILVHG